MLIKPASNRMAYAKIGIYGDAGAGKTFTASRIALGIHKKIKSTKPIVAFDTEGGFSFVKKDYDKQGVELMVCEGTRALEDLMKFMDEAEKITDIVIIDSVTHIWRDVQESFLKSINAQRKSFNRKPIMSLEFQHWRPIKEAWGKFTDRFLTSKLHVIVCGRAGNTYEYQKNETTNKKELISTGTKMAVEKELGYEPSLIIEMLKDREDGVLVNTGYVDKDRSNTINGKTFKCPDFKHFEPHFDCLNLGGEQMKINDRDSAAMFDSFDQGGFDKERLQREIYSEKIEEHLKMLHPSMSADDKQKKMALLEKYMATRSWTEVCNMHSTRLENAYNKMMADYMNIDNKELDEDVTQ